MPNLRQSIIEDYWINKDPRSSRILGWMESMEDWIQDDDEDVAEAVFSLAQTLETVPQKSILENSNSFIKLTAYLSSPRALRLINWFDDNYANNVSLEMVKESLKMNDSCAKLFLDRLQTLDRLSLLSKVFSPKRTRDIVELLKSNTSSP